MIRFLKYGSLEEANHMVAGGLVGAALPIPFVSGLVGQAITFTTPAGSHTFTQVSGEPSGMISYGAIKSQLEANITNLRVKLIGGKIAFSHATAGQVVVIANADQASKAVLGFDNATTISGQFLDEPGGSAPKALDFNVDSGAVYVMVEV